MENYEKIMKLYQDCISSSIKNNELYEDFFHAIGGMYSNNQQPTERIYDKLNKAKDRVISEVEEGVALIRQFMHDVCEVSSKENMTDIYVTLNTFLGKLQNINTMHLPEIGDYRFDLTRVVRDIVIGAEIDRIMQDEQSVREFIRYNITEGYAGIEADEELINDFLYNLSYNTESEITKKNAIVLTREIKQINEQFVGLINKLAVRFETDLIEINPIDSQAYRAINNLYNDFHDFGINTREHGDIFYDTVGEILRGNVDYNIDSITKGGY